MTPGPQAPVERICGARSSDGRMCLKGRGHKNWWHQHGNHIWQSSEEERSPTGDLLIIDEDHHWKVSQGLQNALNEAEVGDITFAAESLRIPGSPLCVALLTWLDEIATIKEEGGV